MTKDIVPATAEGMPKINRSEILLKASREYRFQIRWRDDQSFDRDLFADCLRDQWHYAKMDRQAEVERATEASRLASASIVDRRIDAIKSELKAMEYGDFINWSRHGDLSAELARLAA